MVKADQYVAAVLARTIFSVDLDLNWTGVGVSTGVAAELGVELSE